MSNLAISEIKKTGATFTPKRLADFLASEILSFAGLLPEHITVLDPACGDGMLLYALRQLLVTGSVSMMGYDTSQAYLNSAQRLLKEALPQNGVSLSNEDFLNVCPNQTDLFGGDTRREFADIVIANPPYVRTQILGAEKAGQLARDFGLTGRIDLYFPFLMAMTNALKRGGILGVITSNRYITTKSGADIRRFLLENYDVLEVIDLGDTKLFDAAVLPAIFIGRKKEHKNAPSIMGTFKSIYEAECPHTISMAAGEGGIFDVLKSDRPGLYHAEGKTYEYKSGLLKHGADKSGIWQMSNEEENRWIDTINQHTAFRIKDRFKVRVGIKSCADKIFIDQLWEREGFQIEPALLRPMISQENIEPWHIDHLSMPHVLYPHFSEAGKRMVIPLDKYPVAEAYLEKHREELESRQYVIKAGRKWYEYWVPQNPALWNLPKVVFPDISVRPRFCYDESGAIVNGNCYWICASTEEERQLLWLIEGVSNSEVMVRYHDLCFNNKLYSGRRRYLTQYIEQYPMPDPHGKDAQEIIKLVKRINQSQDYEGMEALSREVNQLVTEAFGLSD